MRGAKYRNWIDYYQQCFNLEITDYEQWLAYSNDGPWKEREINGKIQRYRARNYYIPEFLIGTGLTDDEKNNYRIMNDVAKETKLDANTRYSKI